MARERSEDGVVGIGDADLVDSNLRFCSALEFAAEACGKELSTEADSQDRQVMGDCIFQECALIGEPGRLIIIEGSYRSSQGDDRKQSRSTNGCLERVDISGKGLACVSVDGSKVEA